MSLTRGRKSPNFSEYEKSVLVNIVGEFRETLENKQNNANMIREKEKTWEKVAQKFNCESGVKRRESTQLKKYWQNLKAKAKKSVAKEKRERKRTGGGADTLGEQVSSIIEDQIEPLQNPFDDDTDMHDTAYISSGKALFQLIT